jgi:protein-S-isoprenylcysteine O-methyltransferase Ste14
VPAGEGLRFSTPSVGAGTAAARFAIMLWAWGLFKLKGIPVCPSAKSGVLTTRGPFRFSRNPMYLGMTAILFGAAMWMGTPPFYAAAAIFFILIDRAFIPCEEQKLENAFGAEYSRYRNSVRRWL